MKFSLAWLLEHLGKPLPPDEIAVRLTAAGFNVEVREIVVAEGPRTTPPPDRREGPPEPPALAESESRLAGGSDELWDVEVTTNRPDAMNHYGLAREAAAAGCGRLKPLRSGVVEGEEPIERLAKVTVEDPTGCPRYCARVIRGVKVGPSPAWLAERLERCGIRSINNVVDATNYVLLDLGQPLHAFDLSCLAGREIRVRRARNGERMTTLDGVERAFTAEDVLICDGARAVAVAGVMGGGETEISPSTRGLLLESAYFDPASVRRTARRLGLSTEASRRFERGADRAMARTALDVVSELIVRVAGGEVAARVLDSAPEMREPRTISFSLKRLSAFAGCPIGRSLVKRVLGDLALAPLFAGDTVTCTVPSHRVDLELSEDIYEEVLRHFGYDNIPSVLPPLKTGPGKRLGSWPLTERAREALRSVGAAEAVTYAFAPVDWESATARSPLAARGEPVAVENPLSARMAVMRRSLLAGLVDAAAGNLRRGASGVLIGEVGRAFFASDGSVREEERLALALAGSVGGWDATRATDFLDLKGVVEALLIELGLGGATWRPSDAPLLAPGQGAEIVRAGATVGVAGRLADDLVTLFDLPAPLWVAELDLGMAVAEPIPTFRPLPRFPAVTADLTVRHKLTLAYADLVAAIRAAGPEFLEEITPVVRYRGEGVGSDEVKTTLRLVYRHGERSLTQEEVNAAHFALMEGLAGSLGVSFV